MSRRDRRRITGRIAYLDAAGAPTGRELFSISVHADGSRILRAQCEMDDDALVRDALLVLDPALRPVEAFVRIVESGRAVGSRHYPEAELAGADFFGTHALLNDAWMALLGTGLADGESRTLTGFACSHQANGGGVPALLPSTVTLTRIAAEPVTVAAGAFDTVHWTLTYGGHTPIDVWTTGEDAILVRMSWDHLAASYELVQLDGTGPSD
ncbi:MAG: hypothetical protein INF91_01545 [Alphaproteobacteria bacterium]|nr:hypothetical protein [Alphaproteobacteria bacterium]